MFIQKCKNCSKEFTLKTVLKSVWVEGYSKSIKCDHCNTKHYINMTSRIFIAILIGLTIMPMIKHIPNTILYALLIIITYFLLLILTTPFIARYHVKK
ncbi:hypothetical protein CSC2_21770 [Clostridium zeae]|uniref:Cxxc_20_cxxc protein n=1 Tax=Clostridium zeae TaxID=2759022 RepID=A0ABQ1EA49_9CLOT|nr:TIGR04104 family putative zinc finger protein [Clostridium zeae]GFZ31651.1 hypothetical protein CSC2_21770 [Clostridium zeae]